MRWVQIGSKGTQQTEFSDINIRNINVASVPSPLPSPQTYSKKLIKVHYIG